MVKDPLRHLYQLDTAILKKKKELAYYIVYVVNMLINFI